MRCQNYIVVVLCSRLPAIHFSFFLGHYALEADVIFCLLLHAFLWKTGVVEKVLFFVFDSTAESILSSHPARNIHTKGCWTHAAQTIRAFYRHTHSSHSTKCKLSSDRDSERPLYFDSCRQNNAEQTKGGGK